MPAKRTGVKKEVLRDKKKSAVKVSSGSENTAQNAEMEKSFVQKSPVSEGKSQEVSSENVERILVENFVSLQKVMVNLSVKFDNLTNQISQLLNLFEISARALAEKGANFEGGHEKEILEKIDNLFEQNKTLARGVALLHEGRAPLKPSPSPQPRQEPSRSPEEYQKSISSSPQFNKLPRG